MKPHKWAKEIKAWADGEEIERGLGGQNWQIDKWPDWHRQDGVEFRIKPQPEPDVPDCVKTWLSMGATKEQIEKAVVDAIDKQFPPQPKKPHEISDEYAKVVQQAYEDGFVQGKIFQQTGKVSKGKQIPKPDVYVNAFVYKMIDGEIKLTDRFLNNGKFLGVTNIKLEQES